MHKHKESRKGMITMHVPTASPRDSTSPGWQRTVSGDSLPLYNTVKKDRASYLSIMTEKALRTLHLRIPVTPSPCSDVGSAPWHDLGTELVNTSTAREAVESSGLDYTVFKKPLGQVVNMRVRHNDWAIVRKDTGDVLGIVGDSYEPIQNRDAFRFFDTLVGSNEATYETAGVIGRGERMWILAKLPGHIKVHGEDIVNKYLLLTNSHNGSSLVRVKLTPIRVVCNNTLTAALQGAGEVHIRHSFNAETEMKQALTLLGMSNCLYQQLDTIFNRMSFTKITDKQLLGYVKALVPDSEEEDTAKKSQEIRKAVLELYESGQGADLARGTLWGAFNCVTEYADHLMVDAISTKRLESIWFGRGEQLKVKAFHLAERMMLA